MIGRLTGILLEKNPQQEFNAPLRRAANEATALVWLTPFPLLLLPALLEEKAATARRQIARQNQINKRSKALFVGAVGAADFGSLVPTIGVVGVATDSQCSDGRAWRPCVRRGAAHAVVSF